jgi:hypothetical protein
MIFASKVSSTQYVLDFEVGTYNATLAQAILNPPSATSLPITWSSSTTVASLSSPIDSDSIAVAPGGFPIVASASSGGSTYLYDSWNFGSTWTQVATVAGEESSLALLPSSCVALLTTGTSSAITTETIALSTGSVMTTTIVGGVKATAATIAPNSESGVEGVAAVTSSGVVEFYASEDLGHSFQSRSLGQISARSTSLVLNSVGDTQLTSPGGSAGQISATADGSEVFLAYTTSVAGQDALITQVSPDGGLTWDASQMTQLPQGSMIDPQVSVSPSGYVYVTAEDNAIGTWEADQSVFGADGRLLASPAAIPNSAAGAGVTLGPPSVAVDAFQRPLYVWSTQATAGTFTIQASGSFLSPTAASRVVESAYAALASQDYKPSPGTKAPLAQGFAPLGGSSTSQNASFNKNVSALQTSIANTKPSSSNGCWLSSIQNETAASVYSPATPDPLVFDSSPTIRCANLNPAVHPTSTLAAATGPFAAATYMAVLCDWLFESEAVPVDYSADPLALNSPSPVIVHSHNYAMAETQTVTTPGINAPDGSAVYVFVGFANGVIGGGTVSSLSDNLGNTYSLEATAVGNDHNEQLWVANSVRGGSSLTITATFTPSTAGWTYGGAIDVFDLVGAAAQSVDVVATNTGSGTATSVSLTTTHSMDVLLYGVDGRGVVYPIQPSQGATTVDSAVGTPGPLQDGLGFATLDELQPAAGPVTLGATIGTSEPWAAIGVGVAPQSTPSAPLSVAAYSYAAGKGPTVNATVSSDPAGSALYVFTGFINGAAGGGSVASVTDPQGDSFRQAAFESDSISRNQELWISDDTRGSTSGTTVSVTWSSPNTEGGIVEALDVVGQTNSSLDAVASAYSTSSGTATVKLTTYNAGDLVLVGLDGAMRLDRSSATNGATFLAGGNATTGPFTDGMGSDVFYAPTSAAGTVSLTFTLASASPWTVIAAGIISSAAGNTAVGTFSSVSLTAAPLPTPNKPLSHSTTISGASATAGVTPVVLNPTTAALENVAVSFPTNMTISFNEVACGTSGHSTLYRHWTNNTDQVAYSWSVSAEGVQHTFSSSVSEGGSWPFPGQVYLTNLTPNSGVTWSTGFQATYDDYEVYYDACTSAAWTHNLGFAYFGTIPGFSGVLNTSLVMVPGVIVPGVPGPQFIVVTNTTTPFLLNVGYHWNNTMPAQALASLTGFKSQLNSSWLTSENFQFSGVTQNYTYTASLSATGQPGGWNSSQTPSVNAGMATGSAPQSYSYSCTFQLVPNFVDVTHLTVSNNTTSRAFVSWNSSALGPSWVSYEEYGTGVWIRQSASELPMRGGQFQYFANLEGLSPLAIYIITAVTTGTASGCLTYEGSASKAFLTSNGFPLFEQDQPYDSITQEGGGATIWFQTPAGAPSSAFLSGYLEYSNTNQTVLVPIPSLNQLESVGGTYGINLTLSPPNQNFSVQMQLNYTISFKNFINSQTYNWTILAVSHPLTFTYLRDSSGDGLTDVEKVNGWTVTFFTTYGTNFEEVETANPQLFATNGLVGDYVEKKFGLNPNTVDTAGSHVLDTWNLTFNLGTGNPTLPNTPLFHYWYENGTNPFATLSGGSPSASNRNRTNLTATPSGGVYSGDGSPWASTVLWSTSALSVFENLSGVKAAGWLRAVTMTWEGIRTLTVWGKLSWGANPLAASTPNDGIADGNRINPLVSENLSLNVSSLYVGKLNTSDGYAAYLQLYPGPATSGSRTVANYTAYAGDYAPRLTNYDVVFPTSQTYQDETLEIEVVVNEGGKLTPIAFNNGASAVNITYDMVAGARYSPPEYTSPNSNPNGSLMLSLQAVPVGMKTPTFLWVPTVNGTTNGLPAGLQRYSGEQAFDLVVVNASSSVTSASIPYPWGGNYSLTIHAGLNNLLIPREQFLNSSFAAAILEAKRFPYPSSNPTPPILAADSLARITLTTSFGKSLGLMFDLEAYWQNRSVYPGAKVNFTSNETGISNQSSLQVRVLAVTTAPTNNTGGLFSDPGLYNASSDPTPPALQAIVTLNVSSSTTFDLLLAGLIDNTTCAWDGVNGTFQPVTSYVSSLGLAPPVMHALAIVPLSSRGFGQAPPFTPPKSSSGGLWGDFWNAASAVVSTFAGTIVSLLNTVWTATVAAFTYLDYIAIEAATLGGQVLGRIAATLVSVGDTIAGALNTFLGWISVHVIIPLLAAVFAPILQAMGQYEQNLATNLQSAGSDYSADRSVAPDAARFWSNASGPVFYFATAVAIVLTIVFTLMEGLSLGAGFLIPIIIGLVLTGPAAGIANGGGPTYLKQFKGVDPISSSLANEWKSITGWTQNATGSGGWYLTALAALLGITTTSVATTNAITAWQNGFVPDWTDTWGTVFGVLAIIVAGEASYYSSRGGAVVSVGFDGVSLVLDGISLHEELSLQNGIVAAMDGIAFAIDANTVVNG